MSLTIQPVISADRRFVRLNFGAPPTPPGGLGQLQGGGLGGGLGGIGGLGGLGGGIGGIGGIGGGIGGVGGVGGLNGGLNGQNQAVRPTAAGGVTLTNLVPGVGGNLPRRGAGLLGQRERIRTRASRWCSRS